MLASLPLIAFVLLVVGFVRRGSEWRDALLYAATVWGVLVVLLTEGLGAPGWLTREALAASWAAIDVALALAIIRLGRVAGASPARRASVGVGRLGAVDRGLVACASTIVVLVGVVALLSPPNTWDAMQYHLPRVVRWIEHRSVAFYATHELKQLHMAPGAEYAMLQLHALWGGDRLDNLVQWFAMAGSAVGVSVLAGLLGAGVRGQVLAAVACVTIPEGILAASGAKNDYVLSFWLVTLALFTLRFGANPGWLNAAGIGAGLGLACLTKGTAYAFAPPIVATVWLFWPWRVKAAFVKWSLLILLIAVGLNAGQFLRNYSLYGSPTGPIAEDPLGYFKYSNDVISLPATLSNALRNAVVHVRSEHRATNAVLEGWITSALNRIGADPSDPRTNFFSFMPFRLPEFGLHEGFAGNPAHLALLFVTLGIVAATIRRRQPPSVAIFAVALVVSFVTFSALLKWQPMAARLHLPLFVLSSALVGAVLGPVWRGTTAVGLAALLFVLALPAVTRNEARALARGYATSIFERDRTLLYFGDRRHVADDYRAAVDFVKRSGCRDVGLDLSAESGAQYEYPWLALLDPGATGLTRVIGVTNASRRFARTRAAPCAVVCGYCKPGGALRARYGHAGVTVVTFGDVVVFSADDSGRGIDVRGSDVSNSAGR